MGVGPDAAFVGHVAHLERAALGVAVGVDATPLRPGLHPAARERHLAPVGEHHARVDPRRPVTGVPVAAVGDHEPRHGRALQRHVEVDGALAHDLAGPGPLRVREGAGRDVQAVVAPVVAAAVLDPPAGVAAQVLGARHRGHGHGVRRGAPGGEGQGVQGAPAGGGVELGAHGARREPGHGALGVEAPGQRLEAFIPGEGRVGEGGRELRVGEVRVRLEHLCQGFQEPGVSAIHAGSGLEAELQHGPLERLPTESPQHAAEHRRLHRLHRPVANEGRRRELRVLTERRLDHEHAVRGERQRGGGPACGRGRRELQEVGGVLRRGQHLRAAGGEALIVSVAHRRHEEGGGDLGSHHHQGLTGELTHRRRRGLEGREGAGEAADVHGRRLDLGARGRDAQDPSVGLPVPRRVAPDARVVPVRHVDLTRRAHRHVARPEPLAGLAGLVRPRADQEARVQLDPRAHGPWPVGVDHARPGVAVEHGAVDPARHELALVHRDPRGAAAAVDRSCREDAGVGLVPMGLLGREPRAPVRLPRARPVRAEEAVVPPRHDPGRPARAVPVVVVVGGEQLPHGVDRHLVVVPEVVAHHLDVRPVVVHAQHEPAGPHLAVIAHEPGPVLHRAGPAAAVEAARSQGPPIGAGDHVRTRVAHGHVQLAVHVRHHRVQPVVVVEAAEAGQHHLAPVGDVIPVGVLVHVEVGRAGHVDAVPHDGDPQRRGEVGVLDEDLGRVADPVAVGVLQDHDPVAPVEVLAGVAPPPLAVVHRLGDPQAPPGVHVHGRRVEERRGLRPEGRVQALGHLEGAEQRVARGGVLREERRCEEESGGEDRGGATGEGEHGPSLGRGRDSARR